MNDTKTFNFECMTQYDRSFDDTWKENPDAKKGLACPIFCITTLYEYFMDKDLGKFKHEENISTSINVSALLNLRDELSFDDLVGITSLHNNCQIEATTSELISSGEMPLNVIVPDFDKDFGMIFLKNAKFFVVIGDSGTKSYHVRDCHESFQYAFLDKNDLLNHLNTTYQLNKVLNIGGMTYYDYSSIEYITVFDKFQTNILQIVSEQLSNNDYKKNLDKYPLQGVALLPNDDIDFSDDGFSDDDTVFSANDKNINYNNMGYNNNMLDIDNNLDPTMSKEDREAIKKLLELDLNANNGNNYPYIN